jgi:integrase
VPREATGDDKSRGTVQEFKDARGRRYYRARITLPDGERLWLKPRFDKRERAEQYAAEKTAEAHKRGITIAKAAPSVGETCDKWHEHYLRHCKDRGLSTTGDKGYRWGKYISPRIGGKAPRDVTRDDVEDVRDKLDDAIREERLSWKTAQNAWGELTVSFGEMVSSKNRELRVIDIDPSNGVQPPERGANKSKVYPYPAELLALVSSPDDKVPLAWKELHTVAAFTFMRPGELQVLRWSDVDLADRTIRVTKAWDYKNKQIKATKTGESRSIPIEPALLPLLQAMHKRAGGEGLVVPLLSETNPDETAEITRSQFEAAGCAAERRVQFRSWRDAGITWSIVRGDDVVKVQRRAGHRLIATTMRYIVEGENRGATFGVPFPTLPATLLESSKSASNDSGPILQPTGTFDGSLCERRELNPHGCYPART